MKSSLWLIAALFLATALPGFAGAQKKPAVSVRFFVETSSTDGEKFAMPVDFVTLGRRGYVSKVALLNERDFTHIHVFQAMDGSGTWGAYFFLDEHGVLALDAASIEKRGKAIVAVVNGRRASEMLIDKRITDGVIAIPSGLTPQEMEMLSKTFKPKFPVAKAR